MEYLTSALNKSILDLILTIEKFSAFYNDKLLKDIQI